MGNNQIIIHLSTILELKINMYFKLALLFSLVVAMTGCNSMEIKEPPSAILPALEGEQSLNTNCDQIDDEFEFSLETSTTGSMPSGTSIHAELGETEYFDLVEDCVCKVTRYEFVFSFLPQAPNINVKNASGAEISFSVVSNKIIVYENHVETELFIGFDGELDPSPELETAGGFCIVDNISNPTIPPIVYINLPFSAPGQDPHTNVQRTDIWLPISGLTQVFQ